MDHLPHIPKPVPQAVTGTTSTPKTSTKPNEPLRPPPPTLHLGRPLEIKKTKQEFFVLLTKVSRTNAWPLYIHGNSGCGKTCAAACVYTIWPAHEVNHNGHVERIREPIWTDCQMFMADFAVMRADRRAEATRNAVRNTGLLVLDEIGVRGMTDPQLTAFKEVINLRAGKPLIATSNKTPAELMTLLGDQRIVDRILAGTILELTGASRRAAETKREKI